MFSCLSLCVCVCVCQMAFFCFCQNDFGGSCSFAYYCSHASALWHKIIAKEQKLWLKIINTHWHSCTPAKSLRESTGNQYEKNFIKSLKNYYPILRGLHHLIIIIFFLCCVGGLMFNAVYAPIPSIHNLSHSALPVTRM